MQTYGTKKLKIVVFLICSSYLMFNSLSVFACSSTIVWSTPLSEFLNPLLVKDQVREIVGPNFPLARLTGHVNFLVDGYDHCDSFLDDKSADLPMVLVIPEHGSVKISQHGVLYEFLSETCDSNIFNQNRSGLVKLSASDEGLITKLDSAIVPTGDRDLSEFTQRCSIEANGEFEEVGDDLYFRIERISSLTRYIGKLELEHLHSGDYAENQLVGEVSPTENGSMK